MFDSEGNINGGRGSSTSIYYSDRVYLSHITSNPSLGEDKDAYFSIKACITYIKPDQPMWYRACIKCNRKVTEAATGSGYWCEGCSESQDSFTLRYIMAVKVCDESGDAYLSVFNEQAERIIGCSADELNDLKSNAATWTTHLFRVKVGVYEYQNVKRQRITVMAVAPIDSETEIKFLVEDMSKMNASN